LYLCYFDESGDAGTINSPTDWFVLNCIAVHENEWLNTLDSLVQLRRNLRDNYDLPPRQELKGYHFRNGKGIFNKLNIGRKTRVDIYTQIMNLESTLPIKTFTIAVHKDQAKTRGWDVRYCAWTFAFQRIHNMCSHDDERCIVFPDEGHGFFIRQRIRSMRRYHQVQSHFSPGSIQLRVDRILEDPNDRRSQDSYFIQLADLNAFASHRSKYISPIRKFSPDIWDQLSTPAGDARLLVVNSLRGGPPGIVKYP
jgi:hypothetical protein